MCTALHCAGAQLHKGLEKSSVGQYPRSARSVAARLGSSSPTSQSAQSSATKKLQEHKLPRENFENSSASLRIDHALSHCFCYRMAKLSMHIFDDLALDFLPLLSTLLGDHVCPRNCCCGMRRQFTPPLTHRFTSCVLSAPTSALELWKMATMGILGWATHVLSPRLILFLSGVPGFWT